MNPPTTTAPRSADAGRRPIPKRPTERLPLLLLGIAALIGILLLARIDAPGDPGALVRLPWERVDLRNPTLSAAQDTSPFPEHLRTPWRLYVHPERRP